MAFDFVVIFKDGTKCLTKAEDVIQAQTAACSVHGKQFKDCLYLGPSSPQVGPLEVDK